MPSFEATFDRAPRFVLLLGMILADLIFAPLLASSEIGLHVAQGLSIFTMIAALWAAGAGRALVSLFVPALAANLLFASQGGAALDVAALLLRIAFFASATGLIVWRTMRDPEVSFDTIAGAACAYTLLAVIWASGYLLLELLRPGSFNIPASWRLGPAGDPSAALIYFSFVTLTTVGYGDITPSWAGAGGIAISEAIVGQLYLAITIARLVGLHAARRS